MTAKLCEDSNNSISVIPIERNQPLPMNSLIRSTAVARDGARQPMVVAGDIVTTPTGTHPFGAHLNPANNNNNYFNDDKKESDRCELFMDCLYFCCCIE